MFRLSKITLALAAFVVFGVASAMPASAEEVTIAGYSNGTFNGTPAAMQGPGTQQASLFGLNYTNSTFSGTTVNGFRGLGGNPTPPGTQGFNNLGAFNLANTQATYTGNTFTLRVTFTDPTGIAGSNTSLFSALLVGSVTAAGNGGVQIDFNNAPVLFTFNNGSASGSFSFSVNDLALDPGQTASVTGQITGAQQSASAVPEPATMILLGTGLAGAAGATRRRRNRSEE